MTYLQSLYSKFVGLNGRHDVSEGTDRVEDEQEPRNDFARADFQPSSASPTKTVDDASREQYVHAVHQQELLRRIQGIKCHGWDLLGDGQVVEGDFVLADCAMPGDVEGQSILECAQGVIVKRAENAVCQIAFQNKGHDCLVWATLQ